MTDSGAGAQNIKGATTPPLMPRNHTLPNSPQELVIMGSTTGSSVSSSVPSSIPSFSFPLTENPPTYLGLETVTEDISLPNIEESLHARFYWFGQMFFNCLVAESVFRNADSSMGGASVDVRFSTRVAKTNKR